MTGPLGPRQAAILAHLREHPGRTATELARAFGVSNSLYKQLGRLEQLALVVGVPVWNPDQGRRVTFTWFDPPFRPEPPHSNQAYGICFTRAGMIVLGACDAGGERYWNLLGGGVEPGERWRTAWSGK